MLSPFKKHPFQHPTVHYQTGKEREAGVITALLKLLKHNNQQLMLWV